ncbi:hypothetical protein LPW39_10485 [Comamonas koreensis]|uniref:Lipoprotein n=2 Tax=Comamonas koreensis TaxID=160825 RepID=A0AAW4XVW2_9BURK|nr:hypothetical protein [Comamonas koreensis]MCD2165562.1 hypothetical protein [Comamonas koreensis]
MKRTALIASIPLLLLVGCGDKSPPRAVIADSPEVVHTPIPEPIKRVPVEPFDSKASSIDSSFKGHVCSDIMQALQIRKLSKDQYETSKDYAKRLQELSKQKYFDELKLGDTLAFWEPKDGTSSYDADKGVLSFTPPYLSSNFKIGDGVEMLTPNVMSSSERTYEGSNAFGVKRSVKSSHQQVCVVSFTNFKYGSNASSQPFKIKLPPQDARALHGKIRTFYLGVLAHPYLAAYSEYQKPEINNPIEKMVEGTSLLVKVQQVWIVNGDTGEVLSKRTFK